jgi:hypothetical protein
MTRPIRPTVGGPTRGPISDLSTIAEALEAPEGRARFLRGASMGVLAGAALVGALFQLRRTRRPRRPTGRD